MIAIVFTGAARQVQRKPSATMHAQFKACCCFLQARCPLLESILCANPAPMQTRVANLLANRANMHAMAMLCVLRRLCQISGFVSK